MGILSQDSLSVLGLFGEPESVVRAVDRLRRDGIKHQDISVISGTPYPEGTFGLERPPSKVPWFTFTGAIVGLVVGFAVAGGTALLYPIITSHMSIVALPPVGIITYEVMMLGALVATVVGMLVSARLPSVRPHLWDVCISEGCLGVLVQGKSKDDVTRAEDSLRQSGAADVRHFRERSI
jgi:hypothetical protein